MWQSGSWATGTATWPSDDSGEQSRHLRLSSQRGSIFQTTLFVDPRLHWDHGMADLTDLASAAPPVRSRTQARPSRFGWRQITLTLLLLFLAYQVVIPFLMIIWTSLKTARPGEAEFLELTFTLANYIRAFNSPSFWRTTTNTLAFALASTLLAFVMGAFIAWVVERTNTPLARLIGFLLIGRIIIPGILI